MSTHHSGKPSPRSITKRFCIAFVILCYVNSWTCGQWTIGISIMIIHLSILHLWSFDTKLPSQSQHTWVSPDPLQMCLRVTWGFCPSWKCPWKEPDFSPEKPLCGIQQTICTSSQKRHSISASDNSRTTERSVWLPKGNALKEVRASLLYLSKHKGRLFFYVFNRPHINAELWQNRLWGNEAYVEGVWSWW